MHKKKPSYNENKWLTLECPYGDFIHYKTRHTVADHSHRTWIDNVPKEQILSIYRVWLR